MKNGAKWLVIGLLAMGTLLGRTEESRASGFYDPKAVFTNKERPDFPLESFARGDLGLLQPTYARSYLYVAYRHLAGIGLDKEEQKAVLALWEERMNNRAYDHQNWVAEWMKARRQVAEFDPSPITDVYRPQQLLYWSANCLRDTFRSAIQTLDQRIQLFGADSDDIFEWVTGQDAVLANCSSRDFILPRPARSNHPTLRADRAYQTAAAHFYAGHFEIAEKMFQAIAGDASSPWKTIAPYLAARSLIRRATLISPEGAVDLKVLFQGEAQLEAVLSDARLKEIHPAARRLLGFVRFKLRPVQRFDELGRTLVQKNSGATLKQDLWDYTWLFDRLGARGGGDLTDWILSFQRGATDHALESWRTTQSLPWLAALLASIPGKHPYAGEALKAAAAIDPASPGYPTASYHRARILAEAGRKDEARRLLDKLLAQKGRKAPVPVSARNAFLSQRMPLARNLDEFLNDAPRRPAMISSSVDERELPAEKGPAAAAYFDGDAVEVFNQGLPLSLLKTIALKKVLPAHLRRELAVAAWVRAILLDNEKIALDWPPRCKSSFPICASRRRPT